MKPEPTVGRWHRLVGERIRGDWGYAVRHLGPTLRNAVTARYALAIIAAQDVSSMSDKAKAAVLDRVIEFAQDIVSTEEGE